MALRFAKANIENIPVIADLASRVWRAHYLDIISTAQIEFMLKHRYSKEVIEKDMHRGEEYFIAYFANDAVAYASIEFKENYYYLHKFYVDVTQHRSGIGSSFFDFLQHQIDASKPIRLQVNRKNFKAVNFYFKKGFSIEAVGDFDIGGGYFMNDFVMIRQPNS